MSSRPRILVISFSPIHRDSRVLREIEALSSVGEVTTLGYGSHPKHATHHLELPASAKSLPQTVPGVLALATRRFRAAVLATPGYSEGKKLVGDQGFDLVVANDARALPLAFDVKRGAPVWADMHEWAPEERTHVWSWKLLVAPLMDHLCRTYLPQCEAVSTVGDKIADLYREHYGVEAETIVNAAGFADLEPSRVDDAGPIQLVHSGGAVHGRNIESMIEAVKKSQGVTLDLYLVPGNDGGSYLDKLKKIAGEDTQISFHDPVTPSELPATLNQYDVGIYWIPPYNTNARLALPNKIFDFIQARLAVAVGPTEEMAAIVNRYGLGVVSESFELSDIVSTLNSLTHEDVQRWKASTSNAARELSFEHEALKIVDIAKRLALGFHV